MGGWDKYCKTVCGSADDSGGNGENKGLLFVYATIMFGLVVVAAVGMTTFVIGTGLRNYNAQSLKYT